MSYGDEHDLYDPDDDRAECRDCGQEIYWIQTNKGNRPVDTECCELKDLDVGDTLVSTDGEIYIVDDFNLKSIPDTEGFQLHWDTCPKNTFGKEKIKIEPL